MDKLITTDNGGIPITLDDLRWPLGQSSNSGIIPAIEALLADFGSDFIIEGCVQSGTSGAYAITEGWIMLGGEVLYVPAQSGINEATDTHFVKATTYDAAGDKTMLNGTTTQMYQINDATVSGLSGNLSIKAGTDYLTRQEMTGCIYRDDAGTPVETRKVLRHKVIEIGDWDMDATVSVNVAHGLTATQRMQIVDVHVSIINDASNNLLPLDRYDASGGGATQQGGITDYGSSGDYVQLYRTTSGIFDDVAFDSTSFNRGYVYLTYFD